MDTLNANEISCVCCGGSCGCSSSDCACKSQRPIVVGSGVPLIAVKSGEKGTISRISGKDEMRRHLSDMGFREGEKIVTISEANGSMIVEVKGTRMAIDRSLATRISVCLEN